MVVHLAPEQLACIGVIGIVERTEIARTNPVFDTVTNGALIHPAIAVKFLEMFCRGIEFRPYRYHYMSVHVMDGIDHLFGLRESYRVKLMTPPCVFGPVEPVYDDVVKRNVASAKLCHSRKNFILSVVFLPALPVAHCPFRHDRRFAGEGAVAGNDIIHVFAVDEIIVNHVLHFPPPRHLLLRSCIGGRIHAQTAVGYTAVRFPFDFHRNLLPFLEIHRELIAVGVPGSAPSRVNNLFITYINCLIT